MAPYPDTSTFCHDAGSCMGGKALLFKKHHVSEAPGEISVDPCEDLISTNQQTKKIQAVPLAVFMMAPLRPSLPSSPGVHTFLTTSTAIQDDRASPNTTFHLSSRVPTPHRVHLQLNLDHNPFKSTTVALTRPTGGCIQHPAPCSLTQALRLPRRFIGISQVRLSCCSHHKGLQDLQRQCI